MTIINLDNHIRKFVDPDGEFDKVEVEVDYSQVIFKSETNYLTDITSSEQKDTIDQLEQTNKTSQMQPMQIRRSETVKNSYTWSTEQGFSVGVSVSASFKVPFVGGVDTTVETEYSYSSNESKTEEKSRSWDFQQTVNVPPGTKIVAILMLEKTKPRIPFTQKCTIEGLVFVSAKKKENGEVIRSTYFQGPIASIIAEKPLENFSYDGDILYFKTSGIFQANEGLKAIIDLEEYSLSAQNFGGDSNESSEQPTKRWTIPATLEEELVVEKTSNNV